MDNNLTISANSARAYKNRIDETKLSLREIEAILNPKQRLFCANYLKYNNATEAAKEAGYSEKTAKTIGRSLLVKNKFVAEYINRKQEELQCATIADAKEILQYLTDVMRGEVKDQFGLDASLSERTKAAQELAKRQIDLAAKIAEQENTAKVEITLKRKKDDVVAEQD